MISAETFFTRWSSNMAQITEQEFILQISVPTFAPNTLLASPDFRRAAYISRFRNGQSVVVDGVEGELFEGIGEGTPTFSSDSKHVAYVAGAKGKQFVVNDGKVGPPYDLTMKGSLLLSANGEHLAYGVKTSDHWRIVSDGVEVEGYRFLGDLAMSPDGLRLAWIAAEPKAAFVVVDGVAGRACGAILQGTVVFSPNSKEVAYGAHDAKGQFVIRDGVEGARYYGVPGRPVYSPNSQRLLHPAGDSAHQFVVVDGVARRAFDHIVIGENEIFSADNFHTAYVVKQGDHQHVVVDDAPGPPFDGIGAASVRLSPDGRRVAYRARVASNRFAVCDHLPKPPRVNVWGLSFSPGAEHFAYVADVGRRHTVFVDDEIVYECEGVPCAAGNHSVQFEGAQRLRFVALLGGALYSVTLEF